MALAQLLFADAPTGPPPTWTDKEVLSACLVFVPAVVGLAWGVVKFLTVAATKRAAEAAAKLAIADQRADDLQARLDQAAANLTPVVDDLQKQLTSAVTAVALRDQEVAAVTKAAAGYRTAADGLLAENRVLLAERTAAESARDAARDELKSVRLRMTKASGKDGTIWDERVLADAPRFKPLDPVGRRMPVVSFLNLKGGVGKTTTVAHTGAAFAARGYRVLLIDLDLQGSLSGLFMTPTGQAAAEADGRQIGAFFDAAFEAEFPKIADHAVPLPFPTTSALVPTMDNLAYSETNMMVRWFLREGRDPRFLLRKELHLKRVTGLFDIVLLDCPPLLNISCVNALAASDFLVVPTVPSKQSADRVFTLVQRVKEMKKSVNPDLAVAGVLANRTSGTMLAAGERDIMSAVRVKCEDAIGHPVRVFETNVRQSAAVRDAEADRRAFAPGDAMFPVYEALAAEIETCFPTFCRPGAAPVAATEEIEA